MKNVFFPIFTLLLGVLLLFPSCEQDNALNFTNDQSDEITLRDQSKPFKGEYTTYPTFIGFYPQGSEFPRGTEIHINDSKGNATHLGNSVWLGKQISFFNCMIDGYFMEFIAANGDKLIGTYDGCGSPPDENGKVKFEGTAYVTSGTGRFANVTYSELPYYGWAEIVPPFFPGKTGIGHLVFYGGTLNFE